MPPIFPLQTALGLLTVIRKQVKKRSRGSTEKLNKDDAEMIWMIGSKPHDLIFIDIQMC